MARDARTVGASDSGPGVPMTGWSLEHGDVRVPHFIGLHAIQAALFAVGLRLLRRLEGVRVRATLVAATSYAALFLLLLVEALRGENIVGREDAISIAILGVATALALGWIVFGACGSSINGLDRRTASR
jgi:hypothetical protein